MKVCERKVNAAINAGKTITIQNTTVTVYGDNYTVYLHGNAIARGRVGCKPSRISLAGWNTVTTRSRLNALGAHVTTRKGTPMLEGKPINAWDWFPVD